jgi:hypothetical protein
VTAFRIDPADAWARVLFDDAIDVQLSRLAIAPPADEAVAPALAGAIQRRDLVTRFASSSGGRKQLVEARGDVLFAHAPAVVETTLSGTRAVHLRYGIYEGAWTGNQRTDGVCFHVRAVRLDGVSTTLHERCLDPLNNKDDRVEQEVTLRTDAAMPFALVLETTCNGNCSWDWSYWKDIETDPPTLGGGPLLDRTAIVSRLAASVAGKGQLVEARGALLFAHPVSNPSIELARIRGLKLTYGIFPEAYTAPNHTDGVCFRALLVTAGGNSRKLFERCLTPVERAEDRKDQQFYTAIDVSGPAKLVLETDCRKNCSWDWAWWKDIDILQ